MKEIRKQAESLLPIFDGVVTVTIVRGAGGRVDLYGSTYHAI